MKPLLRLLLGAAERYRERVRHRQLYRRFGADPSLYTRKEGVILGLIASVLDRLGETMGVVYDVGAYNGMWAEAFYLYTRGDVFAFEPLPELHAEIQQRSARSPGIHLQPVACGDRQATVPIYRDSRKVAASSLLAMTNHHRAEFPNTGMSARIPVAMVRLDEWCAEQQIPPPFLVKIDVQGSELAVIRGGRVALAQARYVWSELNFLEFYEGGSTFASVYAELTRMGFELIDCIDLKRSARTDSLLYLDGLFRRA